MISSKSNNNNIIIASAKRSSTHNPNDGPAARGRKAAEPEHKFRMPEATKHEFRPNAFHNLIQNFPKPITFDASIVEHSTAHTHTLAAVQYALDPNTISVFVGICVWPVTQRYSYILR